LQFDCIWSCLPSRKRNPLCGIGLQLGQEACRHARPLPRPPPARQRIRVISTPGFFVPLGRQLFPRVSRWFRHAATACRFGQLALRPTFSGHLPVEGIVMACCKCCCENGSPPGECCGSPSACCKDPDVCCGPSGSKTCCEDPRVCCGTGSGQECCPEGDVCCGEDCCPENQECCDDVCCNEGQYCCDGECSDEPCNPCESGLCTWLALFSAASQAFIWDLIGSDCDVLAGCDCPDPNEVCEEITFEGQTCDNTGCVQVDP
jgi:hypothetical protein